MYLKKKKGNNKTTHQKVVVLRVNESIWFAHSKLMLCSFQEKRPDGPCGGKKRPLLSWGAAVYPKGKEHPRDSSASQAKGCAHKELGVFLQVTQQDWKIKGKEADSLTSKGKERASSGLEATKKSILQCKIILLPEANVVNMPGTQAEYCRNIFVSIFPYATALNFHIAKKKFLHFILIKPSFWLFGFSLNDF